MCVCTCGWFVGSCQCPFALPSVQLLLLTSVGKRRARSWRFALSGPVSCPREGCWCCSQGDESPQAQLGSAPAEIPPHNPLWRSSVGQWSSATGMTQGKVEPSRCSWVLESWQVKGGRGQGWQLLTVLSSHLGLQQTLLVAALGISGAIQELAS